MTLLVAGSQSYRTPVGSAKEISQIMGKSPRTINNILDLNGRKVIIKQNNKKKLILDFNAQNNKLVVATLYVFALTSGISQQTYMHKYSIRNILESCIGSRQYRCHIILCVIGRERKSLDSNSICDKKFI